MMAADRTVETGRASPRPSRERSAQATLWTLVDLAGGQGASFLVFMVLARVIGPAQYGVFAIALSLLALLSIVQFYGFADAIVQRTQITPGFLDTVFWCDLALSLALVAIAQGVAHLSAQLFGEPELSPLVRVLSLLFLLQAFVTVPTALCRRDFRMQVLAGRTFLSYAIGGVVGVWMGLHDYGVWALVGFYLTQYVVILLMMYWCTAWRPGFRGSVAALRELVHFAGHFMFANGLKISTDRFSQLIVALFVSKADVGCFSLSMRIIFTAVTVSISPLERMALPVLSCFADDLPAFRQTYRKMVLVVNAIWMPIATGLGIAAPTLVPLLFGNRWAPAGPVLEAMCLTAPTLGLWYINGQALAALGRPERFTRLAVAYAVLACVAFPFAAQLGIVFAGATWAMLSLLVVPLHLREISKACGAPMVEILSDWLRIAIAAGAMMLVTLGIYRQFEPELTSLTVSLVAGTATYLLLLEFVLMPGFVGRMLGLLRYATKPDAAPTG